MPAQSIHDMGSTMGNFLSIPIPILWKKWTLSHKMGCQEVAVTVVCNSYHTQRQCDLCSPTCTVQNKDSWAMQSSKPWPTLPPHMKLERSIFINKNVTVPGTCMSNTLMQEWYSTCTCKTYNLEAKYPTQTLLLFCPASLYIEECSSFTADSLYVHVLHAFSGYVL